MIRVRTNQRICNESGTASVGICRLHNTNSKALNISTANQLNNESRHQSRNLVAVQELKLVVFVHEEINNSISIAV